MAKTYKGTRIKGMSISPKIFKKSGVKKANKGDKYQNTSEGHYYTCTEGGKPSEARWKYVKTNIVKRPDISVASLGAPKRISGTRKMAAEWKVPNALIKPTSGKRATDFDIYWYLGIAGTDPKEVRANKSVKTVSSTVNLNDFSAGKKKYTRDSFHPVKKWKYLDYVAIKVVSENTKGAAKKEGKGVAKAQRNFEKPRAPVISGFSFNAESGELSCTITTDPGDDYKERYDTEYKMSVYYSSSRKTSVIHSGSSRSTSIPLKFDDANYAARAYGDYAKVTVEATARGYKGNTKAKSKTFYIAYPSKAEIKSVTVSGKTSSDKVTIYLDTHNKTETPVDSVKLEYLPNSDYSSANRIPGDAAWQTTDIIDDAQCNAMAMPVTNLIPDAGKYTWVRLKTYHANEAVLHRYSEAYRVKALETPVADASDDKIEIVSAVPGADGRSALVQLVWDDGDPPSTGTELSWDTEEDAWKSTKDPASYEFTWSDGPKTVDGVEWPNSAEITIKGLAEGDTYIVKARRYLEGDTTTYSEYSEPKTVIPNDIPDSVAVTVARYVPIGNGLNVYWTFSGKGLQRKWQIVKRVSEEVGGEIVWKDDAVILDGDGTLGSTQIPSDKLLAHAENGSLTFNVQVSTGSAFVPSDNYEVTIIENPTMTLTAPAVLAAQPYSFTAVASVPCDLTVIVTSQGSNGQFPQGSMTQTTGDTIYSAVYSPEWVAGYVATSDTEYLDKRYFEKSGDDYVLVVPESEDGHILDPTVNPSSEGWYEEIEGVSATVALPSALDFWDLGAYTIEVTATDRQTQLRTNPMTSSFTVAWAHQAPSIEPTETYTLTADTEVSENKNYYSYNSETQSYSVVEPEGTENPSEEGWYEVSAVDYITLTPIDTVDDAGFHHQAVEISLTPPPGADADDVYDIYRLTGDGAQLIGLGFPLTYTLTDEYAPFSDAMTNHYRIAIRTADGDVEFSDFEYVLEGERIRLDWAGGFIEYPYAIEISDSYSKDVDIRRHLNGGINGYWNQGIERKGSLSTSAIRLIQQADIDLTRQLARYTGPVFVRTPDGSAYEADVQISDLSRANPAVMAIAIDATEIDLTDEFMLPTPFRLVEDGE